MVRMEEGDERSRKGGRKGEEWREEEKGKERDGRERQY